MTAWFGEIQCLDCGHWQTPMAYCPKCGYEWQLPELPDSRDPLMIARWDDILWSYTLAPPDILPGTANERIP